MARPSRVQLRMSDLAAISRRMPPPIRQGTNNTRDQPACSVQYLLSFVRKESAPSRVRSTLVVAAQSEAVVYLKEWPNRKAWLAMTAATGHQRMSDQEICEGKERARGGKSESAGKIWVSRVDMSGAP
jgi:hypothetical protein